MVLYMSTLFGRAGVFGRVFGIQLGMYKGMVSGDG